MRLRIWATTTVLALAVGVSAIGTAHAATKPHATPATTGTVTLVSPVADDMLHGTTTFSATLDNVPAGEQWVLEFRVWSNSHSYSPVMAQHVETDAEHADGSGHWVATWDSTYLTKPASLRVDASAGLPLYPGYGYAADTARSAKPVVNVRNPTFMLRPGKELIDGTSAVLRLASLPRSKVRNGTATAMVYECASEQRPKTTADVAAACDLSTGHPSPTWRATKEMQAMKYPVQKKIFGADGTDCFLAHNCSLAVVVTYSDDVGFSPVVASTWIHVNDPKPSKHH